jgi:hypothetical protein
LEGDKYLDAAVAGMNNYDICGQKIRVARDVCADFGVELSLPNTQLYSAHAQNKAYSDVVEGSVRDALERVGLSGSLLGLELNSNVSAHVSFLLPTQVTHCRPLFVFMFPQLSCVRLLLYRVGASCPESVRSELQDAGLVGKQ